ncbi:MAG: WYL domain-containing protein [Planctomycetaceae bacterium]|nr:WYL domain-containing protein [Planctomycetaceae bacterium]
MSVSRVHRLLKLITLLQSSASFTADELARELEVSKRTIFRDLNMLELANIPYHFDPQRGYAIGRHFFLPPVNLTLGEALAVLLLAGPLRTGKDLPMMGNASRAAMKLESVLPPAIRRHIGENMANFSYDAGPTSRHHGLDQDFENLAKAVAERRLCRIVYISFFDRKQLNLEVQPLRLSFVARAWYLIAWSVSHKQMRTFKLGRIRKLTVTCQTFTPPQIDLDEHFGQAWAMIPEGRIHDIHVHFEPKVAGNVAEVQWHPSQKVQFNDDGSAEMHFRVDGIGEISWWVMGYGDQARVVGPPQLRQRVAQIAAGMVALYQREDL